MNKQTSSYVQVPIQSAFTCNAIFYFICEFNMKIALKQIRNPNTSKCLDSPVDKASMQAAINLWPCHNMGGNQVYVKLDLSGGGCLYSNCY